MKSSRGFAVGRPSPRTYTMFRPPNLDIVVLKKTVTLNRPVCATPTPFHSTLCQSTVLPPGPMDDLDALLGEVETAFDSRKGKPAGPAVTTSTPKPFTAAPTGPSSTRYDAVPSLVQHRQLSWLGPPVNASSAMLLLPVCAAAEGCRRSRRGGRSLVSL